jgi:hypothetical protein
VYAPGSNRVASVMKSRSVGRGISIRSSEMEGGRPVEKASIRSYVNEPGVKCLMQVRLSGSYGDKDAPEQ